MATKISQARAGRRIRSDEMAELSRRDLDVEALNDLLAVEHPIDEYYARSPWPIRLVERRRLSIIREFVGDASGLEVAEVGSGGGHVLRMFPEAKLTAIDVSGVYLDLARRNLLGYDARFLKGELHELALPAGSFDRVICTEVLEHVVDPGVLLAGIARILRTSGTAVITVPNDPLIHRLKGVARRAPMRWLVGRRIEWGGDAYHLHAWTPEEFERVLEEHFEVTDRRFAPARGLPLRACFKCISST